MKIHPAVSHAIGNSKSNPAQAARQAIAAQPELADQPFGKLVSSFARGFQAPTDDVQPSAFEVSSPDPNPTTSTVV
jgi:hypothetical protein